MVNYSLSRRSPFINAIYKYWVLYALALPCVAYLLIFKYYPLILQAILAFKDYQLKDGIWGSQWVGLENFVRMFTAPEVSYIVKNTFMISFLRLAVGFAPPILLAIVLFDLSGNILKRVTQTIIYIPHFFPWTIVYALIYAFFSNTGIVNSFIGYMGFDTVDFLLTPNTYLPLLLGSALWKEIGWNTIIYMAALTAINTELYEVAKIDGAGPLKRIWYVTLPGIKSVVIFLLILAFGNILKGSGTEQILLFYSPTVYSVSDVIDTWVYRMGLGNFEYSLASAASFFQSVFGLVSILVFNKISVKYTKVGLW